MNKKGFNILTGTIMFIILNLVFFSLMFFFIARVGANTDFIEKQYSRQIALSIDSLRPGSELTLYVPELYSAAEKNKFNNIFEIDPINGKLTIRVTNGNGQSFYFLTKLGAGQFSWDKSAKTVIIKT